MTFVAKNAVYALNSYIWKLLEANLSWAKADYGGATPIIPDAQQPEFIQFGKPFLVYGSAVLPTSHLYALRTESIAYSIYAPTSTEANKIAELLIETFERQDEAAADVTTWLGVEAAAPGRTQRGLSFTYIKTTLGEKAEPAETEGGYVAAFVMLEAQYVFERSAQTTGFTYP